MTLGFLSWGWSWQVWCPPVCWAVSPPLLVQRPGVRADRLAQPHLLPCYLQLLPSPSSPLLGLCPGWVPAPGLVGSPCGAPAARVVSCLPAQPFTGHRWGMSLADSTLFWAVYFFNLDFKYLQVK